MSVIARSCLVAVFSAAAVGAASDPLAAQETVQTYTVTLVTQTRSQRTLVHEVLSLQRAGSEVRLRVSGADGSMFSLPVALTASGQIASESQDGSVTCYNMAMGVLAHQPDSRQSATATAGASQTAGEPPSVFVRFFSSVVQIPLQVVATRAAGALRTIALRGSSAGIVRNTQTATDAGIAIDATVAAENGVLHAATFDETHYLGNPDQIVGRSTCIVNRVLTGRQSAVTQT